jgi:hypothetical protein
MRHHPTSGGASVAQNSLLHHHRAPTPWGGGAAHRHYPPRRWRTDGAMAQGRPTCRTRAEPQVWQVWQRIAEKPECGVQRLRHRPPYFPCAAGDSAVPHGFAGSLGPVSEAWPRSTASAAFLRPRAPAPSSHVIPMLALASLPERITGSYQAGHGSRRAVTQTAGRVGAGTRLSGRGGREKEGPSPRCCKEGRHPPGQGQNGSAIRVLVPSPHNP